MTPLTNIELTKKQYELFADFIYKKSGINLGDSKQELVKTRFLKRIRILGLNSYEEYYDMVVKKRDEDELVNMLDAISTNYTFFFREQVHFDFMNKTALPTLLEKKKKTGNHRMRAWCAAASTGEEPYSIMITLMEKIQPIVGWDLKLLATDISTKVLAKAQEGLYDFKQVKTMSPMLIDKYFSRADANGEKRYQIKSELKENIAYRRFNLMTPQFPFKGKFDFIFCRNVMIYFDRPTQEALVKKMIAHLDIGGFLMIGHSETLSGAFKEQLNMLAPATFQKVK